MAQAIPAQDAKPLFTAVPPEQSGVVFDNKLVESPAQNIITYEYFYNGGGVALADFNNDGLIDLYFTSNQQPNQLYFNRGNWHFEDVTKTAGVAGSSGWKTGVTVADVNADGWLDIYVCYSGDVPPERRKNQLFVNNANGTFTDKAEAMGVADAGYSTQAAFFDYDRDGDLDLFVINHNIRNLKNFDAAFVKKMVDADAGDRLYQNNNGKFTDVTLAAGIISNPLGYGLGLAVADFNNDGWPDIYVTNDYVEEDYLYINQQNGSFKESLKQHLGHISNFSMGVDVGDINNDGWADIFTLDMLPETNKRRKLLYTPDNYELYNNTLQNGFYHQLMRNMLHLNNGDGTYSEIGQVAGISNTDWSWSALFADFNTDGLRDLFVSNGYGRDMIDMDFVKFYANERLKYNQGASPTARMFNMLQGVKSTPLHNYCFENKGNLQFADRSSDWGFSEPTFSHGAAYADLDNDGDLDLVINHMNQAAGLYRNETQERMPNAGHFLKIKLKMPGGNRFALGAKVTLFTSAGQQTLENQPVHGFQSAMLGPLHFGFATGVSLDSVLVNWPDGKTQVIQQGLAPDRSLDIDYQSNSAMTKKLEARPVFNPKSIKLPFQHQEDPTNDFKLQPLMPNMLSYAGPRMAVADVNGNGLADVLFCGARQQPGKLLLQNTLGEFQPQRQADIESDQAYEDVDAAFFDADGDGDQDLYVVSGGFDLPQNDPGYQDRFYENRGGFFAKQPNALPKEAVSGACVVPLDYDKDGDLDLYVGGRVVPGRYPEVPESFLLQNDGTGRFTNVVAMAAKDLQYLGLVTDADWADLNGDGTKELLVVGEWMQPEVFAVAATGLVRKTADFFSEPYRGWWNRIHLADMDKDGDLDLIAGNWGENSQYKASPTEPLTLNYADFDQNGSIDPLLCQYVQGVAYPVASRDEMLDQMTSLRQVFTTYDSYSEAKLEDLLSPDQLKMAKTLTATHFKTTYFENKDGVFQPKELPVQASFSPVYAIATGDYNHDGNLDILLGGNVEQVRIKIGKIDANFGTLLLGDGKGNFRYVPQTEAGLSIQGCVRDFQPVNNGKSILVGLNNASALLLNINP
ncbi:MAG: VCBS repeat-containing protein [Saprospiraceae bacterium]|nr:VCBS repeat-containing protein [Saprospiraceae bacterium]